MVVLRGAANAQISDNQVRIGVLNNQSGVYADFGGAGSVIAAYMAVEDVGCEVFDILAADHQANQMSARR